MTRPFSQDQIADHNHDQRKNGDNNPMPVDAHTVALLARARTTSFDEAVSIIQQFADVAASRAAVKATEHAGAQVLDVLGRSLNAPLVQRAHLHDAERIPDVGVGK